MSPVAVIGSGLLCAAVEQNLAAHGDVLRFPSADASVLVVASDSWDTSSYELAHRTGKPWLPVRAELGHVVIGPTTVADSPGCHWCAHVRRTGNRAGDTGFDAWWEQHCERLAATPARRLNVFAAGTVAAVVTEEVVAGAGRTHRAVLRVDLETTRLTRHPFLPVPGCPACGRLPDDNAESARITPQPRRKLAAGTYRVRDVVAEHDDLMATYVDAEYGLLGSVLGTGLGEFPYAAAELAGSLAGHGRTRDYRSARVTAVTEALERHGGAQVNRNAVVRASFSDVADRAVDPRTLGLYPDDRTPRGFRFERYHEDLVTTWVWGYSFARSAPVLVPRHYAYYGRDDPDEPRFVPETSNGCALGGCLEEAILYGLLEVLERDAFLMSWYARMPVPQLDLSSATDPEIALLAEQVRAATGYRLHAFNTTMRQRVPCFWAMAVDETRGEGRPMALCAAGSHIDPERGLLGALYELASSVHGALGRYPAQQERAARMVRDASLVRTIDDHVLTYHHPDAFDRFDFLFSSPRLHDLAEYRQVWQWPEHTDLTGDLVELLSRVLGTGLDVVVVDQTTTEHQAGGFACAKVIVPGMVPLSFGHGNERTHGLPRLFGVPRELGYRDRDLHAGDLNPHPHPFP